VRLHGIYTARFPFLDSENYKIRPVIVISKPYGENNILAVVPVSSRAKPEIVDITIDDWSTAGLAKPSIARVHRLTTVLQSNLITRLGSITPGDSKKLQKVIRQFLEM
jgi:mRNA-degrading endonuclease toxin of MazEF toxin-antitoxin module